MSGVEDFESSDDLYDAIGAILHEVSVEKSENDIKDLCEQLLCLMKPQDTTKKSSQKVLDAPINLAQMAANLQNNSHDVSSIWVINRDDNLVCITRPMGGDCSPKKWHHLQFKFLFIRTRAPPES